MPPKDPFMLLSWVNTQLRDFYPSLDELCRVRDLDREDIVHRLGGIDYVYDPQANKFI